MSSQDMSTARLAALEFSTTSQNPVPNLAWLDAFGPVPRAWQNLFLEEDRPAVAALLSEPGGSAEVRVADPSAPSRVALQSLRGAGAVLLFAIPLPSGHGDRLGESLARERALGEMRMRFLSLVSHEFRTPLTVILSSSELLEHYGWNWPETKRQAHFLRIQGAVATMTSLLDNVAFLGRAESGRLENSPAFFSAKELVDSVVEESVPLRGVGQKIVAEVSPPDAKVELDRRVVQAVISNLLANALRFSPPVGTVTISVKTEADAFSVAVDDEGDGIPHADADRIWEPFERGSNSIGVPGSGLGLAIVRRCMELVGGEAAHLPNPSGRGTRAIATFPRGEAP